MTEALRISDFNYELPEERIAQQAAEPRDSSKLLLYQKGRIQDHVFNHLPELLPGNASLFFNDAKVIPARIFLQNGHGAKIEVFLLQPHQKDYVSAVNAVNYTEWICLIGNKKKWKPEEILSVDIYSTTVQIQQLDAQVLSFTWKGSTPFVELLGHMGTMPLPPYIKHLANKSDEKRYQTVYSKTPGSVAAPTAGLHFTEEVMRNIQNRQIPSAFVTLHVSAGTFLPVKTDNALEHVMHKEIFSIHIEALQYLRRAEKIIAVGTTSCRVLESLYWCAVNLQNHLPDPFEISQFAATDHHSHLPDNKTAVDLLIRYCEEKGIEEIHGETSIMITPGYTFRFVEGLITNFHQPKSTLLLLISAFIGENWKIIYEHALKNNYRFLSYGDSSLLLP